jgi:hypothetical protein
LAEIGEPRWLADLSPAIGPSSPVSGRVRLRRGTVTLALMLLLGLAKLLVSVGIIQVSSLRPAVQAVAPGLVIGGAPSDADLQDLAADFRVDGVVNLDGPSVAEQVTAASLHLGYLSMPLPQDASPPRAKLHVLLGFMRRYTAGGGWVYIHDDVGGGRAVTTAAMLLLLRGQNWPAVSAEMTTEDLGSLSGGQRLAIKGLEAALHPARGPAETPAPPPGWITDDK